MRRTPPTCPAPTLQRLQETWTRPRYKAGFLIMGANTRLPHGDDKVGNTEALGAAMPP
jgi:hypothetical protein